MDATCDVEQWELRYNILATILRQGIGLLAVGIGSVLFTIVGAVKIELLVVEDVTGKNGSVVMPIHKGKKTQI
ncbi:aminoglycoside [Sesbania bispinosa]|nr:aminoglycoside [Sesbania bispinosa]